MFSTEAELLDHNELLPIGKGDDLDPIGSVKGVEGILAVIDRVDVFFFDDLENGTIKDGALLLKIPGTW